MKPLAERIRPQVLADVVGQTHLLADNAPLACIIKQKHLPSLILHGEAGIGKTTLAMLLAKAVDRPLRPLSAINAGVKEIREALAADDGLFAKSPVVFVDEIHRFNKAQQDALLHAVETGEITLIGATTENPSFSVNNALLSRCQVYRLNPLSPDEITTLIHKAIRQDVILKQKNITIKSLETLIGLSQGDGRRALNLLELVCAKEGAIVIDNASIMHIAGESLVRYDKHGEHHHNLISAMIKSVRGSDPDAAVYWLARMLNAGEDPAFIARRLVILASEDIGLANPNALLLADTALRSVQAIGMPEARIILGQVAIYLSTSPKSNSSYNAINLAISHTKNDQSPVPQHLCNAPTALMQAQGYGVGYIYPHDYPNHYHPQQYLPSHLLNTRFYQFGDNQKEQASFAFLNWLKNNHRT